MILLLLIIIILWNDNCVWPMTVCIILCVMCNNIIIIININMIIINDIINVWNINNEN